MSEERFVIRVVNEDKRYIATSEYFPECVGVSTTEKGAVRKLKNLIMEKLKKTLKTGVKVLCSSEVEKLSTEEVFKEKLKVFDEFLDKMTYPANFGLKNEQNLIMNPDVRFNLINASLHENPIPLKPGVTPYFVSPIGNMEDNMGYVINLQINLN